MRILYTQKHATIMSIFDNRWSMQLNMHLVSGFFDTMWVTEVDSPIGYPAYEFSEGILTTQVYKFQLVHSNKATMWPAHTGYGRGMQLGSLDQAFVIVILWR